MNKIILQQGDTQSFPDKWIETKTGRIYYTNTKKYPEALTVVFMHGLSSNHTTWVHIVHTLEKLGYNTLTIELRGHGLSDKRKKKACYQLTMFADDLQNILQKEKIKRFIIVGYSYGGAITLEFMKRQPSGVQGLFLISTSSINPLKNKNLSWFNPLAKGLLAVLSLLFIWQKRKSYLYYRHGQAKNYWHSVWLGLNSTPLSVNFWMLAQMLKIDFTDLLPKINVPAVLVRGLNDPFISKKEAENMIKLLPNGQLETLRASGHFIGTHCQEEILQLLWQFLKKFP